MKIAPINIYKNYSNCAFGKTKEIRPETSWSAEDKDCVPTPPGMLIPTFLRTNKTEIKELLKYLLPEETLQESRIDTAEIEDFGDKLMPRITTPDGKVFVIDTQYTTGGAKLCSVVYELNDIVPVKMSCVYKDNKTMYRIAINRGEDDRYKDGRDILILLPNNGRSPTWIKERNDKEVAHGTIEEYLEQLNLGLLE